MVIHLDPHQLAVLDGPIRQVVVISQVFRTKDETILHFDIYGKQHVFDDIESLLEYYDFDSSNSQWMMS